MLGHTTYLTFELAWALPVLALQWGVGRSVLWRRRAILAALVLLTTLYLSSADSVAIAHHIWTLHANRIIGVRMGNLPLEEIIFFLLTNAIIVQSILLVADLPVRRPWIAR